MAEKAIVAETKKELIEQLELLATFFTLAGSDAGEQARKAKAGGASKMASFCAGREAAYGVAFLKIDTILKVAKK